MVAHGIGKWRESILHSVHQRASHNASATLTHPSGADAGFLIRGGTGAESGERRGYPLPNEGRMGLSGYPLPNGGRV